MSRRLNKVWMRWLNAQCVLSIQQLLRSYRMSLYISVSHTDSEGLDVKFPYFRLVVSSRRSLSRYTQETAFLFFYFLSSILEPCPQLNVRPQISAALAPKPEKVFKKVLNSGKLKRKKKKRHNCINCSTTFSRQTKSWRKSERFSFIPCVKVTLLHITDRDGTFITGAASNRQQDYHK